MAARYTILVRLLHTGDYFARLRQRVCGAVFDSCPGSITVGVMYRVLSVTYPRPWQALALHAVLLVGVAAQLKIAHFVAAGLLPPGATAGARRAWAAAGALLSTLVGVLMLRSHSREYNASFRSSPARWRELYVYCDDDAFVHAADTTATMAARREAGVDVSALRLASSLHVAHLLRHPAAYEEALTGFIGRVMRGES